MAEAVMEGWVEDATWRRRFDDKPNGRRAKIWHCESYGRPAEYHWRVDHERGTVGYGAAPSWKKAARAVEGIAARMGWL
jgi:hypothetical protein